MVWGQELVRALVGRNRRRGTDPDGWGPTPRYERESDVPWQVFARAEEAMME